jgi:hypothetical protein
MKFRKILCCAIITVILSFFLPPCGSIIGNKTNDAVSGTTAGIETESSKTEANSEVKEEETKTETTDATDHDHNWVAQTTTEHHDSEGMFQQVQTGTQKIVVCDCGERFDTTKAWKAHKKSSGHTGHSKISEPVYETKWVETKAAWDETVTTYTCSICGATK